MENYPRYLKYINGNWNLDYVFLKAASQGQLRLVKYLVFKVAPPIVLQGFSLGAENGQVKILEYLNLSDPLILNYSLVKASEKGYWESVSYLLEKGADPNHQEGLALEKACSKGHLKVVRLLAPKIADINGERSFLSLASLEDHLDIVKYLLTFKPNSESQEEALANSSYSGYLTLEFLLNRGISPNVVEGQALILACQKGHLDRVQLLLERGADVHLRNDEALVRACEENRPQILRLLLEAGANPKAQGNLGWKLAKRLDHTEIIEILKSYRKSLLSRFKSLF